VSADIAPSRRLAICDDLKLKKGKGGRGEKGKWCLQTIPFNPFGEAVLPFLFLETDPVAAREKKKGRGGEGGKTGRAALSGRCLHGSYFS